MEELDIDIIKERISDIFSEPGSILTGDQREFVRTWANTKEITVKGYHFIQEHSPNEIGEAIKDFLTSLS